MIATINAQTSCLITRVGESITTTRLTHRKPPMILHAHITLNALDLIIAIALAGLEITKIILRTSCITITRLTPIRTELPRAWRTSIALNPDYVLLAFAHTTLRVAYTTHRPGWVTVTRQRTFTHHTYITNEFRTAWVHLFFVDVQLGFSTSVILKLFD